MCHYDRENRDSESGLLTNQFLNWYDNGYMFVRQMDPCYLLKTLPPNCVITVSRKGLAKSIKLSLKVGAICWIKNVTTEQLLNNYCFTVFTFYF